MINITFIKYFPAASIALSDDQIPIGQTFTISVKTTIPKGKGDVQLAVNCGENCQFIGELKVLDNDAASVVVQENTIRFSETAGGMFKNLYLIQKVI